VTTAAATGCGTALPTSPATGLAALACCPWCGTDAAGSTPLAWGYAAQEAVWRLSGEGLLDPPAAGRPAGDVLLAHGFRPGEDTLAGWAAEVRRRGETAKVTGP